MRKLIGTLLTLATAQLAMAQVFSMVKDIYPGNTSSLSQKLVPHNGSLLFAGANATTGTELWKTDGTNGGTVLLKDISPGTGSGSPSNFTAAGGVIYFTAADPLSGNELWRTDGTVAGTRLVKDIYVGSSGSHPTHLTNVNGKLFFFAKNAALGYELWKTDGTSEGTVLVKDIYPGPAGSFEPALDSTNVTATIGNLVYFTANDGLRGVELWRSDGTFAGTHLVKDINPGPGDGMPHHLVNINGKLFFTANNGSHGKELWRSDGSSTGSVMLKDIHPGAGSSNPHLMTVTGSNVFFAASDGIRGEELWKTDGTEAGTSIVKDINPGEAGSKPADIVSNNGSLFFIANDGSRGRELFKSNGTATGTTIVKDVYPGAGNGTYSLSFSNNKLFFSGDDGLHGHELWSSDGTIANTVMVQDIMPGSASSNPQSIVTINARIFLSAWTGTYGREIWMASITANVGGLPLTMLDFSGALSGADVILSWKTVAEQNTSHFEIERNIDGRSFMPLGTLPAAGNSASVRLYDFTDRNVRSLNVPVTYYRLKMKDNDGKFTYSKIIAVSISSNQQAAAFLYPSPAADFVELILASAVQENVRTGVFNSAGVLMMQQTIRLNSGSNSISINTEKFASGSYYVHILGSHTNKRLRFLKQ